MHFTCKPWKITTVMPCPAGLTCEARRACEAYLSSRQRWATIFLWPAQQTCRRAGSSGDCDRPRIQHPYLVHAHTHIFDMGN